MAAFREGTGIDFTNASEAMMAGNAAMDNPSTRWTSSGVESVSGALNDFANRLDSIASENSALSQSWAEKQMAFQRESQLMNMRFNSAEAAKNRAWQEYMSNSAHQRETRDLLLAGLNPVLSATGGNGAAVGSGATASNTGTASGASGQVDTSMNNAIVNLLGSMLNNQTHLAEAAMTANNNMAMTQLTNATNTRINEFAKNIDLLMNRETNQTNRDINKATLENAIKTTILAGQFGVQQAGISAHGAMAAAAATAAATRYAADMSYKTQMDNPNSPWGILMRYANALGFGPSDVQAAVDNMIKSTGNANDLIRFWSGLM